MRNFIETYDVHDKTKVLIHISSIKTVSKDADNYTFIELKRDNNGHAYGIKTNESYDVIFNKIYYAQGGK